MDNSAKIRQVSLVLEYVCYLFIALAVLVVMMMLYHITARPDLLELYVSRDALRMIENIRQVDLLRATTATLTLMTEAPGHPEGSPTPGWSWTLLGWRRLTPQWQFGMRGRQARCSPLSGKPARGARLSRSPMP